MRKLKKNFFQFLPLLFLLSPLSFFAFSHLEQAQLILIGLQIRVSPFYLLFISRFVCTRRCYSDKGGIFPVNQTSMYLIHIRTKGEVGTVKHVGALH